MATRRECPYCGAAQDAAERFCAKCGNEYPFDDREDAFDTSEGPTATRVARRSGSSSYRVLAILAAALVGVVALGYGLFRLGVAYFETGRPDPGQDPGPILAASPTRPSASPVSVASPPVVIQPSPSPAPPGAGGARVRVAKTDGQGANMRERPSTSAPVVKVLPDGSVLDVVGPDQQAEGRAWRNVRDPDGASGWVAAELLEPA
jgi:hypothetical protein